ncbi:MAG: tetratricopeptide repeat protein, partial [Verrucomicrobia bacterium]|nr:tetratricopeptide repeat protein [Cytophagales bacterium]
MKKILTLLFLLFTLLTFAQQIPKNPNQTDKNGLRQGKWTLMFDKDWKPVTQTAFLTYYRILTYKDDKPIGTVTDYYLDGKKQFEGQMTADRPEEILEGTCTWFTEAGSKEVKRTYQNGKQNEETYYKPDGTEEKPFDTLNEAIAYYKEKKYDKSLSILERYFTNYYQAFKDEPESLKGLLTIMLDCYQQTVQLEKTSQIQGLLADIDKNSPDTWEKLNKQGMALYQAGKYAEAIQIFEKAKVQAEREFGKEHADYATSLNNLAGLYDNQGNYAKAEPLYLEASEVYKKALGKEHPDYATSLNNLALLYKSQGYYAKAEPLLLEAQQVYFNQIDTQFSLLSDKEKEAFFKTFNFMFEIFNSFVLKRKVQNPAIVAKMYDNLLVTKAFLFNTQNKIRNNILSSNNPKLIQDYQNWQAKRQYLAKVYQMTLNEKQKAGINVAQLEDEANNSEKQLSAQSEAFAQANDKKRYSWQDIQKTLKPKEAAIEIVRFRKYAKKWTDTVYYAALIITPTAKLPELVLLENGKELETKGITFYKTNITLKKEESISYGRFWQAIAGNLKGIEKVYFSPDGIYNALSLNTLLNPKTGKYLSEEINIHLLTSTKDLITQKRASGTIADAVLFGFPNYSNAPQSTDFIEVDRSFTTTRSGMEMKAMFAGVSDLPETQNEVNNIGNLLKQNQRKATIWVSALANEVNFKKLENPGILHIATHGFFLKDIENTDDNKDFNILDKQKPSENPLLRSG